MTQEEINKAFEGRWRIKGNYGQINTARANLSTDEFYDYIKDLCKDFFETGVLLADDGVVNSPDVIQVIDTSRLNLENIGKAIDIQMLFEHWWNLYDLKCGRKDCEKKWAKLSKQERADCMAATPAYVASTPDKQFRKRPLTYLNQKAWNDEIIIRNSKDQQRSQRLAEAANLVAKYTGADKGTKG